MRACVLLIFALGLATDSLSANVTAADYARAEQLLQYNSERLVLNQVDDLQWMTRQVFWYRRRSSRGIEFIRVDASHGTRRPLFDPEALKSAVRDVLKMPEQVEESGRWSFADALVRGWQKLSDRN